MTDRRLNITVTTGILLLAAGIFGAGFTYRSMRTENLTHARTGEVGVPFADTQASASARFRPYTDGTYRVYIGPPASGGGGCAGEAIAANLARLDGIIDVTVSDGGGRVRLSASLAPGGGATLRTEVNGWVPIDSLLIRTSSDSAWNVEVSFCPGSQFVPSCAWAVFLLPPQQYEIGSLLEGGVFRLLAFFGIVIIGFLLIVIGGRKSR